MSRFAAIAASEGYQQDALLLGQQLADEVERRFTEKLRAREKPTSRLTNRASSLGDPCLRRMVLWRTQGEQAKGIDDTGLAIFALGHLLEGPVRRYVEELGFEIEKAQLAFPPNDFKVSGHIDGVIRHHRAPVRFILEIKTLNGATWKQLKSFEDIREHAKSWVAKYYSQGMVYAALGEIMRWDDDDIPIAGVLYVLFNKWTGELRAVPAPLDYGEAEKLLDKSVEIEAHVAAKTLPEYIEDKGECISCPFHPHVCKPPMPETVSELRIIEDPDVLAALETRANAAVAVKDYVEADDYLFGSGGRLRGLQAVVVPGPEGADWHVKGAFSPSTSYKVPEEVRAPYKTTNPQGQWRKKIELVKRTS